MAYSLGPLCYMEPINTPKVWLKPGAQAWDPGRGRVQGQRLGRVTVFKMEDRLQGSGWELQSVGDPAAWSECSKGTLIPSLLTPLQSHCLENQAGWGGRRLRAHAETGHRGPGQSGTTARALLDLPPSDGSASRHPCLPLEPDAGQARNAGLEKTSHTYPTVAYL